jgi:hypothetical protein
MNGQVIKWALMAADDGMKRLRIMKSADLGEELFFVECVEITKHCISEAISEPMLTLEEAIREAEEYCPGIHWID